MLKIKEFKRVKNSKFTFTFRRNSWTDALTNLIQACYWRSNNQHEDKFLSFLKQFWDWKSVGNVAERIAVERSNSSTLFRLRGIRWTITCETSDWRFLFYDRRATSWFHRNPNCSFYCCDEVLACSTRSANHFMFPQAWIIPSSLLYM